MKSFREAYKKEVERIPVPVITMEQIADEKRRKKVVAYRKHRRIMAVASAACVFLLYTAGAVAAAGYARSVIEVDEYGFKTADAETALLSKGIAEVVYESNVTTDAGDAADGAIWEYSSGTSEEEKNITMAGSANVTEEEQKVQSTDLMDFAEKSEIEELEVEEIPSREYFSYGAFSEAEQIPFAMPELSLLGSEVVLEHYTVLGNEFLMVRMETVKGVFMVNQTYYGNTLGHASSTVYPGGVCNEREYQTARGFTWLVVDSKETEDGILRIHAAISVGDYELIVDFDGYTEEEAYNILETMDLTLYL